MPISCLVPQEGEGKTGTMCALDCGAGIGRITKRLLLPLFQTVDLVDVTQEFLDQARTYLGEESKRVGHYFCTGLQDFVPEPGRYDVIWIQWVIGGYPDGGGQCPKGSAVATTPTRAGKHTGRGF